ncbi:MAG: hypothetical protein ACXVAY_01380 [Mucilaginibacter sp.]
MANTINGTDLKATFGWVLTKAPVDLLKFPDRKDSVKNDWMEENGVQIDLALPRFKARQFTLNCAIIANDRADFKSKYNGLFTLLSEMDTFALYLDTLDETFHVYYVSQSNLAIPSKIKNGEVVATFDLVFGETDPGDNFEPIYLIDDDGDFIII